MSTIPISVRLDAPELSEALAREVAAGLEQAVERLQRTLGVPVGASATVVRGDGGEQALLAFTVAGTDCAVPDALPPFLDMYLRGEHDLRERTTAELVRRLVGEAAAAGAGAPPWRRLVEFVALTGEAAVSRRPSVCFDEDAFRRWSGEDAAAGDPPAWLAAVLRELLDLGLSIADRAAVAAALRAAAGDPPEVATEALLAALTPDRLRLRIDPGLLRRATTRPDPQGAVDSVADQVFRAVGLPLPPVHLEPDEAMPPDTIAVGINHLPAAPRLGLPPSQVMLSGVARLLPDLAPDDLPYGMVRTRFPGTTEPVLLTDEAAYGSLPPFTTYDAWEHLLQWLAAEVRANAWRLVSPKVVKDRLDDLQYGAPSLVEAVQQQVGAVRLARLLRALLADGVPVGNLLRICDELLQAQDGTGGAEADDREVVAALRVKLGPVLDPDAAPGQRPYQRTPHRPGSESSL